MRILITGLRAPVALEWARRFDQAEHEVIGADCLSLPIGRFSKIDENADPLHLLVSDYDQWLA